MSKHGHIVQSRPAAIGQGRHLAGSTASPMKPPEPSREINAEIPAEIPERILMLDGQVDALQNAVARLEDKLTPVLRQVNSVPTNPASSLDSGTPLGEKLTDLHTTLGRVQARIEALIYSTEL